MHGALRLPLLQTAQCIKCIDTNGNPWNVFGHILAHHTTDAEHQSFAEDCLPAAFNDAGELKADYTCPTSSTDYGYFKALVGGY